MQVSSKQSQDGSGNQKEEEETCIETYQCRMYSGKLLMMGRADARNM